MNKFYSIADKFITLWKRIKPSNNYWTVAIPTVAFILSQAKSWKIAIVIASYSEKQIENSDYSFFWLIINSIATEFYDTANWELVFIGMGLLIIITYAFVKENDSKNFLSPEDIRKIVAEELNKGNNNKLNEVKSLIKILIKENEKLLVKIKKENRHE